MRQHGNVIATRVNTKTLRALKREAKKRGRSLCWLIREACERLLKASR